MNSRRLFQVYELVLKALEEQLDVLQSQSLVDIAVALSLDLKVEVLERKTVIDNLYSLISRLVVSVSNQTSHLCFSQRAAYLLEIRDILA